VVLLSVPRRLRADAPKSAVSVASGLRRSKAGALRLVESGGSGDRLRLEDRARGDGAIPPGGKRSPNPTLVTRSRLTQQVYDACIIFFKGGTRMTE